jgi:hypothetical protein
MKTARLFMYDQIVDVGILMKLDVSISYDMGWPDLLMSDVIVKMAADDEVGDNLVSPMNSPRLSPDANATALNPLDIHDSAHLPT